MEAGSLGLALGPNHPAGTLGCLLSLCALLGHLWVLTQTRGSIPRQPRFSPQEWGLAVSGFLAGFLEEGVSEAVHL